MKNLLKVSILLLALVLSSCSKDDDSSNSSLVEIVLTEGKASYMKVVPIDKEAFFDAKDVKEYKDESQVSFSLPEYANHFSLEVQGSQKKIKGYVKINGIEWEFNAIDWYYQGTYYLSDFK